MNQKARNKIYKTSVSPTVTDVLKTSANNKITKSIFLTIETKVLRNISGYTLRHKKGNTDIKCECEVEDIIRRRGKRRTAWNYQVVGIARAKLVKTGNYRPKT